MQESLLAGFQRENEKAMRDLERARQRERLLEGELEKLLGPNWAVRPLRAGEDGADKR